MSTAIDYRILEQSIGQEGYIGPAEVIEMRGTTPYVRMPSGGLVRARMALAFPYAPQVGDQLLVIGRDEPLYVIGVLEAGGEVSLRFKGDVSLEAVGGKLSLASDETVEVRSPDVAVRTRKFRLLADRAIERLGNLYQRVRGQLDVHAGQKRELIDGNSHAAAENATIATRGLVTINGKQVHLA